MTKCIKCGYEQDDSVAGNTEYKDKCYTSKCGWEDKDVDEHLHVSCANCGYVTVHPCNDYTEQKAKESIPAWAASTQPVKAYQPSLYTVSPTRQSAWDTKSFCSECPVEK